MVLSLLQIYGIIPLDDVIPNKHTILAYTGTRNLAPARG
jgi:hypothetical protein